jgi:hypothetical protein
LEESFFKWGKFRSRSLSAHPVATAKNENLKPDLETIGKSRVPAQEKQRGQLTLLDEARWGKLTIARKESRKPDEAGSDA